MDPERGDAGLGYLSPSGYSSQAYGISRDGSTIVGTSQSNSAFDPVEAFRWTQSGGMQLLPLLPGAQVNEAERRAVNATGTLIVGSSKNSTAFTHAVRWIGSVVEDLAFAMPLHYSHAYAVSDIGLVIGGTYQDGATLVAFVWTPTLGMTDLSSFLLMHGIGTPANYRLESVRAISGDGLTFGGYGVNLTTNIREGFVATIPSPGTVVALLLAPFAAARRDAADAHRRALAMRPPAFFFPTFFATFFPPFFATFFLASCTPVPGLPSALILSKYATYAFAGIFLKCSPITSSATSSSFLNRMQHLPMSSFRPVASHASRNVFSPGALLYSPIRYSDMWFFCEASPANGSGIVGSQ